MKVNWFNLFYIHEWSTVMLKRLNMKNLTLFPNAHQQSFAAGLNVFVGENGTGKTQMNHPFSQALNYNFKIQPY